MKPITNEVADSLATNGCADLLVLNDGQWALNAGKSVSKKQVDFLESQHPDIAQSWALGKPKRDNLGNDTPPVSPGPETEGAAAASKDLEKPQRGGDGNPAFEDEPTDNCGGKGGTKGPCKGQGASKAAQKLSQSATFTRKLEHHQEAIEGLRDAVRTHAALAKSTKNKVVAQYHRDRASEHRRQIKAHQMQADVAQAERHEKSAKEAFARSKAANDAGDQTAAEHHATEAKDFNSMAKALRSKHIRNEEADSPIANRDRCPECGGDIDDDGCCEDCGWCDDDAEDDDDAIYNRNTPPTYPKRWGHVAEGGMDLSDIGEETRQQQEDEYEQNWEDDEEEEDEYEENAGPAPGSGTTGSGFNPVKETGISTPSVTPPTSWTAPGAPGIGASTGGDTSPSAGSSSLGSYSKKGAISGGIEAATGNAEQPRHPANKTFQGKPNNAAQKGFAGQKGDSQHGDTSAPAQIYGERNNKEDRDGQGVREDGRGTHKLSESESGGLERDQTDDHTFEAIEDGWEGMNREGAQSSASVKAGRAGRAKVAAAHNARLWEGGGTDRVLANASGLCWLLTANVAGITYDGVCKGGDASRSGDHGQAMRAHVLLANQSADDTFKTLHESVADSHQARLTTNSAAADEDALTVRHLKKAILHRVAARAHGRLCGMARNAGEPALSEMHGEQAREHRFLATQNDAAGISRPMSSSDDPHQATKAAAAASLHTEHSGAMDSATTALGCSADDDCAGAAQAHLDTAETHDQEAMAARKSGDQGGAADHEQAAMLHRKAAGLHRVENEEATKNSRGDSGIINDREGSMTRGQALKTLTANVRKVSDLDALNALSTPALVAMARNAKSEGSNADVLGDGSSTDQAGGEEETSADETQDPPDKVTGSAYESDPGIDKAAKVGDKSLKAGYKTQGSGSNPMQNRAVQNYLKQAPAEIQGLLTEAIHNRHQEKVRLVNQLISNIDDKATRKRHFDHLILQNKDVLLAELERRGPVIENSAREPVSIFHPSFLGAAGSPDLAVVGNSYGGGEQLERLEIPTMNWAEDAEEVA